jgi:hypothetical protein
VPLKVDGRYTRADSYDEGFLGLSVPLPTEDSEIFVIPEAVQPGAAASAQQVRRRRVKKDSVTAQARNIVSSDIGWLALALLIMCIAEDSQLRNGPFPRYMSIFGILFEMISAYGTVGLSLGYPGTVVSLSGQFHIISKLVICCVMLAGRHRGLPFAIDSAIYLPKLLNAPAPAPAATAADADATKPSATLGGAGTGAGAGVYMDAEEEDDGAGVVERAARQLARMTMNLTTRHVLAAKAAAAARSGSGGGSVTGSLVLAMPQPQRRPRLADAFAPALMAQRLPTGGPTGPVAKLATDGSHTHTALRIDHSRLQRQADDTLLPDDDFVAEMQREQLARLHSSGEPTSATSVTAPSSRPRSQSQPPLPVPATTPTT